jgi:hypothetical protein
MAKGIELAIAGGAERAGLFRTVASFKNRRPRRSNGLIN